MIVEDIEMDALLTYLFKLRGKTLDDIVKPGKPLTLKRTLAYLLDFPGGARQLSAVWDLYYLVQLGLERAKLAFDMCCAGEVRPLEALKWFWSDQSEEVLKLKSRLRKRQKIRVKAEKNGRGGRDEFGRTS